MKPTIKYILATLFVFGTLTSCDDYQADTQPDKLFRPTVFRLELDTEITTSVRVTWRQVKADGFLLQFSESDQFPAEGLRERWIEHTQASNAAHTEMGLAPQTKYYARVKALSDDPRVQDSDFTDTAAITLP